MKSSGFFITILGLTSLFEVDMAAGECNLDKNLSENLSRNENNVELGSSEERDFVSGFENTTKNSTENVCFNTESETSERSLKLGEKSRNCDVEGYEMKNKTLGAASMDDECCNKEGMDSRETNDSGIGLKPVKRSVGRTIDEVFNEEDEMEKESNSDEEEHYESAEEEHLTPEEAEERMKEALELKSQGNDHFRKQEYVVGKDLYSRAIKRCPKEFTENKSIFYSNRAACYQKMEDYESAISDCSKALELNPKYLKARLRRAQCFEKVEKLEEALEDYKIVFENDRSCQTAREAIMRLPEEIKVKHEKLKEEMIGKLKDLGNMVLRPFGLSTDNFKLQQDPNSGGYSVNFEK